MKIEGFIGGSAFLLSLRQFLIKVLLLGTSDFFLIGVTFLLVSRAFIKDQGHTFLYLTPFLVLVRLFIKIVVKPLTPKAFFKISRSSIFVFKLAFQDISVTFFDLGNTF